jgi:hypothetical protein
MLTVFFPSSFTAEDFEFWVRQREKVFCKSGLTIFFEPGDWIEWWVDNERSLAA